ncbi:proline-rich protein 12-like isoform X2 [Hippocampus zosterae]|nr:proline-rich protein 12-like isoform X2 [Hippocampus zosterae]XP_051904104.1 proline-rich protein 12-like isoform X2 [Hippocampus zosterae]
MYGSARSSHHDSELLHRQAYGSPHPLQGYATNHHPGGSRQGGAWAGRTLGLSGLFDAGLHHTGPSGPDPSVMNLISALDSRGPQPPPSASSLLTQFRTPSWQTAMHSPAPTELFLSGALPGAASFSSSSALSAYQHPGSFSGRSFAPSLSLQDTAAFSPNSNGLLSPHDPLMHIKTPSQSSLGFDRLLSSQSGAYRSSQELAAPPPSHAPPGSSGCHLPPPQFNLLSSQLHNQSPQLYNASMFSSTPALITAAPAQERTVPRQDSVIKHYQRSSPAHCATLPPQQYLSCAGSLGYQQLPSQHHHAGVSYSPSGEQSPPADPKRSPQAESRPYPPNLKTPYASSSSSSASSSSAETKEAESSATGYSSNSLSSSSRASHTPPPSSNGSSSPSNPQGSAASSSVPSRQQPPPQPAPPPAPAPAVSSAHSAPKACLSTYGSPAGAKSSTSLSGQTPPQQQARSYSPEQLASPPVTRSCFSSPQTCDMSSGAGGNGGKAFADLGAGGRSFSAEIVFGDSSFGSAPRGRAESPSRGYGTAAGSTGSGASAISALESGLGSVASGSGVAGGGGASYHLNESSPSPAVTSTVPHPGLHSPASSRPAQSPGGSGTGKYPPSMLSPTFAASSHNPSETQQPYRPAAPKTKTQANVLGVERSQMEEADDFLIQQLLRTQSSHSARHPASSLRMPQQLAPAGDTGAKGATYDMSEIPDERHHLHSVIRANSATDPDARMSKVTGGLKSQLEISRKKQQQPESELTRSNSTSEGVGGVPDPLSHPNLSRQPERDSLVSAGHYGRGDPYGQHPHSQHSHHISHPSPHSQKQAQCLSQHPQPSSHHSHSQHAHMELKKTLDRTDDPYSCDTTDAQQSGQNQMMNSQADCPQQTQMLHSLMPRAKMDPQRAPRHHPLSQQGIMGPSGGAGLTGADSHAHGRPSQLQLQLQNQNLDPRYHLGAPRDQSQDMLDRRLSQPRSRESGGPLSLDRHGIGTGANITDGDGVAGESHGQQLGLSSHHLGGQTGPELHGFLPEPDLASRLHHVNQPQSHAHHRHHQPSHSHLAHPQSHQMVGNMGPGQQLQQSQAGEADRQPSHSQLERLKPHHHFDTVSPGGKTRLNPNQQQEQFTSLTSICFSDSLLNDDDRNYFPGVEDMFCSANYKPGCDGDSGSGQASQESVPQGRGQDGMEVLKTGDAGQAYGLVAHHGDQGYGQYCHSLSGLGNTSLNADLDSMKTQDLPSTVNTDQLGLIQSQAPAMGLNATAEDSLNKMTGCAAVVGGPSNSAMAAALFCSPRPKKLLKTSSFHLLKQRREPQPLAKKNYAQEYEFEDDEDKADAPADIRLNSRRLPDLLPDLVSSCRKSNGASPVGGLGPLMGDVDFCHPSGYSSLGQSQPLLAQDGPKKRGRKPTKPKREGPPRPRGRPRIRPLPEPSYCRGLMGSAAGESRRGRGRGRGRGRREEGLPEMHQDMSKAHDLPYQQHPQPHFSQERHLQRDPREHHGQRLDHHQMSQQQQGHLLHHPATPSHHQMHHQPQPHAYQQHVQLPTQQLQQDPGSPIKVTRTAVSAAPPSESFLRSDSLSGTDPAPSDGSMGSAASLGPSPAGPASNMDISRKELNQTQDKMHHDVCGEMLWKKEMEDPLSPEAWGAMQKISTSVDEKAFDFKAGFMSSFLDFLKTGKKQPGLEAVEDPCDPRPALKGGIRPITPTAPLSPPQPAGTFGEGRAGPGADLALASCPSPCKPLDDELKGNLEALPSFSSDEEDSVSKNQDLQKSISSAISALYDTLACAAVKAPSAVSPPSPREPPLSPSPPAVPPLVPSTAAAQGEAGTLAYGGLHLPDENLVSSLSDGEEEEESQSRPTGEHRGEEEGGEGGGGGKTPTEQEMKSHERQEQEATEADGLCPGRPSSEASQLEDSPAGAAPAPALAPTPAPAPAPAPTPPPAPPSASPSVSPTPPSSSSPSPLSATPASISASSIRRDQEADPPSPARKRQRVPEPAAATAGTSPPPSASPPAIPSPPLSNLAQSHSVAPPSTTPPPSCSDQDQDQEPEAEPASPSSPSSSSPSPSCSPPTPEEAPAARRLAALHLAKKQADAAVAGQSEDDDSESGGEGIFRERDEFVIRTEDVGTLKMALRTGREPPPIWRVQKALLQKFSPEIKDGQRQFCATSNYLGYFGDAKMRYQRLYVKFLENVDKKDYVRVCSRKPWRRTALTLRRQSLPKQLAAAHNPTPPGVERDDGDKDGAKEKEPEEKKERDPREKAQKAQKERQRKEEPERDKRETRERRERGGGERGPAQKGQQKQPKDGEKETDKTASLRRERQRGDERQREAQRDPSESEKRRRGQTEQRKPRESPGQKRERPKAGKDGLKRKERAHGGPRQEREKEAGPLAGATDVPEVGRAAQKKVRPRSAGGVEPPSKKTKSRTEDSPSSSSESDSSLPSEDEGPPRLGLNSRAMREMFRSYVEMLVSTALDPDMIQALEDTHDELYLPPMRKIDGLLNERKKSLLRRVGMSAQHQEALQIFPKMTADAPESGTVKVRLDGEVYNRKTLNRGKRSVPKQQDLKLSRETCRIYSLYHSLHHYKYHTFLHCKKETASIEQAADDPGQEEVVQQCMANRGWLESLFHSFMELLGLGGKA